MFAHSTHATLLPGDPPRETRLALWTEHPDPDDPTLSPVELLLPGPDGVAPQTKLSRIITLSDVLDDLVSIPAEAHMSASVMAWSHIARIALGLIARGRLQPSVSVKGYDSWIIKPLTERDIAIRDSLAGWLPPEAHCTPLENDVAGRMMSPTDAIDQLYEAVADVMVRTSAAGTFSGLRAWAGTDPTPVESLRKFICPTQTVSTVALGLRLDTPPSIEKLSDLSLRAQQAAEKDAEEEAQNEAERVAHNEAGQEAGDAADIPKLDPNLSPEPESGSFHLTLQVRSLETESVVADAADVWAGDAVGFDHQTETELLVGLRRAARVWPTLNRMLEQAQPTSLVLTDSEAMQLFGFIASDLAAAGVEVLIPHHLTNRLKTTARVISPEADDEYRPSNFGLDSICELSWSVTLDGEPVTPEELQLLAEARRPLVKLRGQWVLVDPNVLERLNQGTTLTGAQAIAAAISGGITLDDAVVEVESTGVVATLAQRVKEAGQPTELPEPVGLTAELRPYQRRGLAWLTEMSKLGLGGILADDMGLGKTVQLIGLHMERLDENPNMDPTLVICPTSVIGNWGAEIDKFAPSLTTRRYHGPERDLKGLIPGEVVITTYGIARRDADLLAKQGWGIVVADEAQQIKNSASHTAKALRKISSSARIAMTGTPVENRLSELWAILDWTTPGLLGPLETFKRNIAIPVEHDLDPDVTAQLAKLLGPFLMRRKKTDPGVAPDLPPKTETDHPIALSEEQAGLYKATVDEILEQISSSTGMARRGLVLKLLTALKHVCNHPAHYLGEDGPLQGRSAKMDAFDDLITSICDAGDSTLVFTQYVKMGNLLVKRLNELGIPNRFLHGSQTLKAREEMVATFQAGEFPVFVISLKAGGTGLNLTQATHVIHYDRWWNPAVENQASDRAWRIGQDRPVQIHRLICEGTLEERIAVVLERKQALADAVVGSGESWLTELNDVELAGLVELSSEVV